MKKIIILLTLLFSLTSCQDAIESEELSNNPYIEVKCFARHYHIRDRIYLLDTVVISGHYITNDFESIESAKLHYKDKFRYKLPDHQVSQYLDIRKYLNDKVFMGWHPGGNSYIDFRYELKYVDKDYKIEN